MIRARSVLRATQVLRSNAKNVTRFSSIIARRALSSSPRVLAERPQQASTELASALRAEQKIEQESAQETAQDVSDITGWAKENKYEIIETPGSEQVQLVRKVSDTETLRVFFSISDLVNSESLLDDAAPFGENGEGNEEVEDADDIATPVHVNIVVEKPNGALGIEGIVQDDLVLVESVIPYADAKLALEESAEADYARRSAYQGPPFSVLDPSVQAAVQQFLDARALDGDFALFVQEYAAYRENQEYIDWLGKIAKIVE